MLVSAGRIDGVGVEVGFPVGADMGVRPGSELDRTMLALIQGDELRRDAVDFGLIDEAENWYLSVQVGLSDRRIEGQRSEQRPVSELDLDLLSVALIAGSRKQRQAVRNSKIRGEASDGLDCLHAADARL